MMLFVASLGVFVFVIFAGAKISMSLFKEPQNGGHRQAHQASQGDPDHGAHQSAGTGQTHPSALNRAYVHPYQNALQNTGAQQGLGQNQPFHNVPDYLHQMDMQRQISYQHQAMMAQIYGQQAAHVPLAPPAVDPKLETVMTLGEIIGWRVWRIDALGQLQSGYKATVWAPGIPMTGDPQTNHGVHAFKELGDRVHDAAAEYKSQYGTAIGRVALWGDVIEHERGYRAEFAKVVAIDSVVGVPLAENAAVLARLRQAYCASTIEARSDETPSAARPEGRERGGEAETP